MKRLLMMTIALAVLTACVHAPKADEPTKPPAAEEDDDGGQGGGERVGSF